jgi:hypothetical protein
MLNNVVRDLSFNIIKIGDEVYHWDDNDIIQKSSVSHIRPKKGITSYPAIKIYSELDYIHSESVIKPESISVINPEIYVGDLVCFKLHGHVSMGEVVSKIKDDVFLKDPIQCSNEWKAKTTIKCCLKVEDGKKSMIKILKDIK